MFTRFNSFNSKIQYAKPSENSSKEAVFAESFMSLSDSDVEVCIREEDITIVREGFEPLTLRRRPERRKAERRKQ